MDGWILRAWPRAGVAALVLALVVPAAAGAAGPAPRVVLDPLAPGQLFGVAATSASDAWAVGTTSSNGDFSQGAALIMHWNGSGWTKLPSPGPAGSGLSGVAARTPTDLWAVGSVAGKTLILHGNGSTWTRVPSPAPGRTSTLAGVVAIAPGNAWAVGRQTTASFSTRMLILHWNGSVWKRVPAPSVPKHFESSLAGVSATSARDVWAVGSMTPCGCGPGSPVILHWNGRAWQRRSVSIRSGFNLGGVAAVSPRRAWVVGASGEGDSPTRARIARFNGRVWKLARTPSPGAAQKRFDVLSGVGATSARDVWAVGTTDGNALIEHWTGSAWKRVASKITAPPPDPGVSPAAFSGSLFGVAATSPRDAWAVGSAFVFRSQSYLPVILHWNGTAWS